MVSLDKLQELNKWWTKGNQFYLDDADLIKYQGIVIKLARKEIVPLLKPESILIIKGPRRAGKTIAIKLAIWKLISEKKANPDDILYFSFDEIITPKDMDNTIRNFLSRPHSGTTYLFLDEIQTVRGWADVLLGLSNSGVLKNTAIVATGSIAHFLGTETLPGRGTEGNIYYLRTASFRTFVISLLKAMAIPGNIAQTLGQRIGYRFTDNEVKSMLEAITNTSVDLEVDINQINKQVSSIEKYFIPLNKMFELYIYTGGYPVGIASIFNEVLLSKFYEEIYNYIKNDAATITSAVSGDPLKASQAVSGILEHVGEKVSYSKIAQNMSMNKTTLIDYSNRLENSFVFLNIKGMKSFENGLKESGVKKFYFEDVFMHYAAGAASTGKQGEVYSKEIINSSRVGIVVEEIVAGHLIRVKESDPMKLYGTYLRFYDGTKEVDFIYRRENNSNLGIEAKYQVGASLQDIKFVKGIDEYILLTKSSDIKKGNNCVMFPIALFLAILHSSENNL
jgi:predicted AAA+ superfamily ATPase